MMGRSGMWLIAMGALVMPVQAALIPRAITTVNSTPDVVIAVAVVQPPRSGADASVALQAAIDRVADAGGGTIFLPCGRYRCTDIGRLTDIHFSPLDWKTVRPVGPVRLRRGVGATPAGAIPNTAACTRARIGAKWGSGDRWSCPWATRPATRLRRSCWRSTADPEAGRLRF